MGNMEFENFGEFVGFCETAKPEEWSEEEKTKFNKKVTTLLKDKDFSEKYEVLYINATRKGIRHDLAKKRRAMRLRHNRDKYRTAKMLHEKSKANMR